MSLIRYVQGETSLSALSKATTSDVEDAGQDPGKRPSDRIKGNVRTGRGGGREESEREETSWVKKGEERINGQLPENYIAS